MENTIRIIIADDHRLFAEGLNLLINKSENMDVVGIASDGRELLEMVKAQSADIVLLDINMPNLNGLDAIRYLKMHNKDLKVIVISTYAEMHIVDKARNLGAHAYILKNSNQGELIAAVQTVVAGGSSFPDVYKRFPKDQTVNDPFLQSFQLSAREKEIIQLIKQSMTNREISKSLSLSIYTVETHRKNIMQKLQLKSPAALMKFIVENNL